MATRSDGSRRAASHPARAAILRAMVAHGPLSPVAFHRLAPEWSLAAVSYHFRKLRELGAIVEHDHIPRRGAVEHIYRPAVKPAGPEVVEDLAQKAADMLDRLAPANKRGDDARALATKLREALPPGHQP